MYRFLLSCAFLTLGSCIHSEIIDFENHNFEDHLVVYSLLCPQVDSIYVFLFETNNDFETMFRTDFSLSDGLVTLTSNNQHIELKSINVENTVYACSQSEFQINKGDTYTLIAIFANYPKIKAVTKIPSQFCQWMKVEPPYNEIIDNPGASTNFVYHFNGEWTPLSNEKNYFGYRTGGIKYELEPTSNESVFYRNLHYKVIDSCYFQNKKVNIIEDGNSYSIFEYENYTKFSHLLKEEIAVEYKNGIHYKPTGQVYTNITYYLITADENFSNYLEMQKTYNEIREKKRTYSYPYNMVLPTTSNIEGGYGVFGSYGFDSVYFDVSKNVKYY